MTDETNIEQFHRLTEQLAKTERWMRLVKRMALDDLNFEGLKRISKTERLPESVRKAAEEAIPQTVRDWEGLIRIEEAKSKGDYLELRVIMNDEGLTDCMRGRAYESMLGVALKDFQEAAKNRGWPGMMEKKMLEFLESEINAVGVVRCTFDLDERISARLAANRASKGSQNPLAKDGEMLNGTVKPPIAVPAGKLTPTAEAALKKVNRVLGC
jgi:hypothetical protein